MIENDTAISVNGLEKSYGNLKVLDKINFTVKKGSIFALLGSNGSGKTTTVLWSIGILIVSYTATMFVNKRKSA